MSQSQAQNWHWIMAPLITDNAAENLTVGGLALPFIVADGVFPRLGSVTTRRLFHL